MLFVDVDGRIECTLMIDVVASVVKAMNLHQNMRYEIVNRPESLMLKVDKVTNINQIIGAMR